MWQKLFVFFSSGNPGFCARAENIALLFIHELVVIIMFSIASLLIDIKMKRMGCLYVRGL